MWNSEYFVNVPSSTENIIFSATKYPYDDWGRGTQYSIWAEARYLDENGGLITSHVEQAPQGTAVPDTLDFDVDFGEAPTAKSATLRIWVYSLIHEQYTRYNITITRT